MRGDSFEIGVDGGLLRGSVVGRGDAVLLLHGGPGLPWTYMQALVDEICDGYQVAVYQQRGLPPSTAGGPFDVPTQVADVLAVLDGLGWQRAVVIGLAWAGHLLLHLLAAHPERVAAAMVIDPLGGVGDGGEAQFEAELNRRTPTESVERAQELDQRAMDGQGTEADAVESLRLYWPAYFANPAAAPPFPEMQLSVEAYSATFESLHTELPGLAGAARRPGGAHLVRSWRQQPDAGRGIDRHRPSHRPRRCGPGARRRRPLRLARPSRSCL